METSERISSVLVARRVNVGYISGILCLVDSLFSVSSRSPLSLSDSESLLLISPSHLLLPISTSPLSPSVPPPTQLSVHSQRARTEQREEETERLLLPQLHDRRRLLPRLRLALALGLPA